MRLILKILSLSLFIGVSGFSVGSLQAQTRGIGALQDADGSNNTIYNNSYAILVGIDKYEDSTIRSLDYAVADAESIKLLIQELGFPEENIFLLENEEATLEKFRNTYLEIGRKTEFNDRILVYWAGHGETEKLFSGKEEGYLVTYDGYLSDLYSTSLSMYELQRLTERVPAKHQLFLVDACYGGLAAQTRGNNQQRDEFLLRKVTATKAVQIITAGGKDEQVVESPEWGHSAFAKALIDGFRNRSVDSDDNGLVTADELYTYLRPKVIELSGSVRKVHSPIKNRFGNGEGEFVFIYPDSETEVAGNLDFPEWFSNPPNNFTEGSYTYLYSTSMGATIKEAITNAFVGLSFKMETKVHSTGSDGTVVEYSVFDRFSSSLKARKEEPFLDVKTDLESMEEKFTQFRHSKAFKELQKELEGLDQKPDSVKVLAEKNTEPSPKVFRRQSKAETELAIDSLYIKGTNYSFTTETTLPDGSSTYHDKFYSYSGIHLGSGSGFYELVIEEHEDGIDYYQSGSEDLINLGFDDLMQAVEASDKLKIKIVKKEFEHGSEYFVLLEYKIEKLEYNIE